MQMEFCCVLKISLDGCQKKVAWSDPTRVKTWDSSKDVGTIGYDGVCMPFD